MVSFLFGVFLSKFYFNSFFFSFSFLSRVNYVPLSNEKKKRKYLL